MNSSEKEKAIFRDLFIKSIDGQITEEEIRQFNALLSTYPNLEDYYIKCVQMQFALREIRIFNDFNIDDLPDYKNQTLWKALADAEKDAPAIEISVPDEPKILIQKVQREKVIRKISKSTILTLCTAAAAVILIFVFAHFAPTETGMKVAVLSDCFNAKWADSDGMEKGLPVFTSYRELLLHEGYAKLLFDNQTQVTIEAPAKFQILADDKIHLRYGRVYAVVPPEAIGFMITTQNAKVIDLGTEFGVEASARGDISLHVMKGRTTLIAGEQSNRLSMDVSQGVAKRVSSDTQKITSISCNQRLFVRDIDSASETLWRGEKRGRTGYIDWTAQAGNWADGTNWDAGVKPDGSHNIRLRNGATSVCTINTAQKPVDTQLTVTNGQTVNIENGGYIGCGWSRFSVCTVNMTGNGTLLMNDDDLYIGYPIYNTGNCVWTMSDTSTIAINQDNDDGETLYIGQDNARGTLRIIGSKVTVHCDQFYIGYVRTAGFEPKGTLEYVIDAGGVSTIHVGYRLHLSEEAATSHLVVSAKEPLAPRDLVLIETQRTNPIAGDGVFDSLNEGPAVEGTAITLGGNRYILTYQYDANGDGCRNDVALVYKEQLP